MDNWAVARLVINNVPMEDRGSAYDVVWALLDGDLTVAEAREQLGAYERLVDLVMGNGEDDVEYL